MTDAPPYRVEDRPDGYRVVNAAGHTILECRDENSAHHYVDLLSKAHRAGYKCGYRAGKAGVTDGG